MDDGRREAGLEPLAATELGGVLDLSRRRHETRLARLVSEGVSVEQTARCMLSARPGRSGCCVADLLPEDLTAVEYLDLTTELDEHEAEARARQCAQCSPRGGRCEGSERLGLTVAWDEGWTWQQCERWAVHVLDQRLRACGYPERLVTKGFATFSAPSVELSNVLESCLGYVRNFEDLRAEGKWMLNLVGPIGGGKTHLAVATARELHARGLVRTSAFFDVEELLFRLRQHNEDSGRLTEQAMGVDLLVLDDLNTFGASDWSVRQIGMVMNHRWRENKPMIVTSNDRLDAMARDLDQRTISRMMHVALTIAMSDDVEDHRLLECEEDA